MLEVFVSHKTVKIVKIHKTVQHSRSSSVLTVISPLVGPSPTFVDADTDTLYSVYPVSPVIEAWRAGGITLILLNGEIPER